MIHYFLTGEKQIGKSTIIEKTAAAANVNVGGFKTYFGSDRFTDDDKYLYVRGAAEKFQPEADVDRAVAFFSGNSVKVYKDRFDTLAAGYIKQAFAEKAGLLIMDELGFMEREALVFQKNVIDALNYDIPIIGVIRKEIPPWTRTILEHPNVRLINVTLENRDELADAMIDNFLSDSDSLLKYFVSADDII